MWIRELGVVGSSRNRTHELARIDGMKNRASLALAFALLQPFVAEAGTGVRVAELFTSQSCSSSPSADRVLGELAKEFGVIALSCNVTYWNHLGWRDTLSNEFCDARQRRHVRRLNANGAYTPQLVINGRTELVGSREREVRAQLVATPAASEIEIGYSDGALVYELPAGLVPASLILVAFDAPVEQEIPTGENAGRRVRYANPIRDLVSLAKDQRRIELKGPKVTGGYAVLAEDEAGNIVAAGATRVLVD